MCRLALNLAIWFLTFVIGASLSVIWKALSPSTIAGQPSVVVEHPNIYLSDERKLLEIEYQYVAAEQRHDIAFFDAIEAEGYTLTESDGAVLSKAEALEEMRADNDYPVLTIDDVEIRVYGDTAVVTGRLNEMDTDGSGAYKNQTRWTDVFVKLDGCWQVVNTQVTAVDDSESSKE